LPDVKNGVKQLARVSNSSCTILPSKKKKKKKKKGLFSDIYTTTVFTGE
jgi:hypothetical protein